MIEIRMKNGKGCIKTAEKISTILAETAYAVDEILKQTEARQAEREALFNAMINSIAEINGYRITNVKGAEMYDGRKSDRVFPKRVTCSMEIRQDM